MYSKNFVSDRCQLNYKIIFKPPLEVNLYVWNGWLVEWALVETWEPAQGSFRCNDVVSNFVVVRGW